MTSVPQHADLEWPSLEPTCDDFIDCMGVSGFNRNPDLVQASNKIFTIPTSLQLPRELNFTVANLKRVTRSAGTAANHRSAAASAWLMANSSTNFSGAAMAWSGTAQGLMRCFAVSSPVIDSYYSGRMINNLGSLIYFYLKANWGGYAQGLIVSFGF